MDFLTPELLKTIPYASIILLLMALYKYVAHPLILTLLETLRFVNKHNDKLEGRVQELEEIIVKQDEQNALSCAQIEKLQDEVKSLKEENKTLKAQWIEAQDIIKRLREQVDKLISENNKVTTENHNLKKLIDNHPEIKKALKDTNK